MTQTLTRQLTDKITHILNSICSGRTYNTGIEQKADRPDNTGNEKRADISDNRGI